MAPATLASDTGSGATFTAYDTDDMGTTLYVAQGTSIPTPITVKPMISPAALDLSIDDYQPYAMTNRELTEANSNLITGKLASVTFTNGSASVSIPAVKTTSRIIVTRNSGGAIHQVLTGNCSTNGTLKIGAYDVANAADFSGELSNITYLIDNR